MSTSAGTQKARKVTLDDQLDKTPTDPMVWSEIGLILWDQQNGAKDIQKCSFAKYYKEQCGFAFEESGKYIICKTHSEILRIATQIKAGTSREKISEDLWKKLRNAPSQSDSTQKRIDNSIDLAARLLVMMAFGKPLHGMLMRCDELHWDNGTLKETVRKYFEEQISDSKEYVKLESLFNAQNLVRIAGLEIEWTSNLADHLRLTDSYDSHHHRIPDSTVYLFHYANFLQLQKKKDHAFFPDAFVEETLRTIALLLPRDDPDIERWYCESRANEPLDKAVFELPLLRTEDRMIDRFSFWRERLIILKHRFDESEPKGFRQWRHDKRKRVQWYTFWIAIVGLISTAFFSLVQSIEGGIQVYKAYHPSS